MIKHNSEYGGIGWIVAVAILAVILIGGIAIYGYVNGLWNTGIEREKQLTAQYLQNQNYLSGYISGFYEQLSISTEKADKLNVILEDAVKGRYEKGGLNVQQSIFTAIVEAYPDLKGLDIYDKMMNYIASGREGYRNIQDKLLDQLRSYDTWKEQNLIQRQIIKFMGFPTDKLEARIGVTIYKGAEARDRMYLIVLASDAKKAYETGVMDPLKPPSNKAESDK